MHEIMKQALAPFAPPQSNVHVRVGDGLNDDDIYVVNVITKRVIEHHGCKSATAQAARYGDLPVEVGQALVTGMQARSLGVTA